MLVYQYDFSKSGVCLFFVNPKKLKLSTHSIGVSYIPSWNLGIFVFVDGDKSYILIN